ncbi:hypothetical protein C8T65DRAFT_588356 [Cerioporus squamosus]|nr:hypothetical protein C8T65DRAFT_588356 [Cerioporus squamosus]
MSESPPQKRARTEGPDDSASAGSSLFARLQERARRHREATPYPDRNLWFEDGTTILKTQRTILKVYKGPLIQHSSVFRNMFSLPQPQTEEVATGPATVELFDPAYDVRALLQVLMPSKYIQLSGTYHTSCDEVCACPRMAHKYEMDQLLEKSLQSLRSFYPDTYQLFKERCNTEPQNTARAISVVNLGRLVEAPSLLPMAIVDCCTLGSEIVNGYKSPDLTEEHLSPSDIGFCFQAKDKLIEARVRAFKFPATVRGQCPPRVHRARCR